MKLGDIKEYIAIDDAGLEKAIVALEDKNFVMVLRNRRASSSSRPLTKV